MYKHVTQLGEGLVKRLPAMPNIKQTYNDSAGSILFDCTFCHSGAVVQSKSGQGLLLLNLPGTS